MNKAFSFWVTALTGVGLGLIVGGKFAESQYAMHCKLVDEQADHFSDLSTLMRQWIKMRLAGHTLGDYFKKNNYKKIAVYGMNETGHMVLQELETSEIDVLYCIDRNADNIFAEVDVRRPDDDLQPVDAVVVAVIQYYDEVKKTLSKKLDCPVISLSDVVWET